VDQLANYGALGVIVIAFLSGLVFAKPTVDRLIKERDKAEDQRDSIVRDVHERVAPALEQAVEALKARSEFETDVRDVLVDVRRMLEQRQ
jgi:hypothetical protein